MKALCLNAVFQSRLGGIGQLGPSTTYEFRETQFSPYHLEFWSGWRPAESKLNIWMASHLEGRWKWATDAGLSPYPYQLGRACSSAFSQNSFQPIRWVPPWGTTRHRWCGLIRGWEGIGPYAQEWNNSVLCFSLSLIADDQSCGRTSSRHWKGCEFMCLRCSLLETRGESLWYNTACENERLKLCVLKCGEDLQDINDGWGNKSAKHTEQVDPSTTVAKDKSFLEGQTRKYLQWIKLQGVRVIGMRKLCTWASLHILLYWWNFLSYAGRLSPNTLL